MQHFMTFFLNAHSVRVDGLLLKTKDVNIGCFIGNLFVGALAYANDVTRMAPSAAAMRRML